MRNETTKGARLLRRYLKDQRLSQRAFAEMIGVKQAYVSRMIDGHARPSITLRYEIAVSTDKAVPFDSWMSAEERKLARRAA